MAVIGLDATNLSVSGKGLARYQYNLLEGIARIDRKNTYYVFLNGRNEIPLLPEAANFHYVRTSIPSRILWDQVLLPRQLAKYRVELYHSVNDTLPLMGRAKFVLCAIEIPDHRIALAEKAGGLSLYTRISQKYNMLLFPPSLARADAIIANSFSTKREIAERYGIDEGKIEVLYLAQEKRFEPSADKTAMASTRRRYGADNGYILHISSSDPRDNTAAVILACSKVMDSAVVRRKLIIGGDVGAGRGRLASLIDGLGLKGDVIFTGRLAEDDLLSLYQAADVFVDPSLFEGFGLQVAEAMACGVPVITSNVSSLPEVVGDAGVLVDPSDIDGIASAELELELDLLGHSLEIRGFSFTQYLDIFKGFAQAGPA